LPRAVGYSAGLLNYFFRGQNKKKKDPNNPSQYIIKNESDEYMSGTFSLYYDDTNDNRRFLTSWGRSINAVKDGKPGQSDPVTFTEPTDMKEKGKYILVFQGTLGSETGAVVGMVVTLQTSKELILYKVGNKYKTYNTHTKVAKDYTGIIPGSGEGRVIWNEDGSYALTLFYPITVTNMNTGQKYSLSGDYNSLRGGAWIDKDKAMVLDLHYSGNYTDKWKFSKFENGFQFSTYSQPSNTSPLGNGYYNFRDGIIASAWDGSKISYGAGCESGFCLITFDTAAKLFSTTPPAGGISYDYRDGNDTDPIGTKSWQHYTVSQKPYALTYDKKTLKVLYMNEINNSDTIIIGKDAGGGSVWNNTYSKISTYDKLETFENSGTTTTTWTGKYNYYHTTNASGKVAKPLEYFIMKDGKEIVSFTEVELSYYKQGVPYGTTWTLTYNTKLRVKFWFNGAIYSSDPIESNTGNAYAYAYNSGGSITNFNFNKDKALISMSGWLPDSSKPIRQIFYISNGAVQDITNDHPDFQTAGFFTFVKE
ncbi:MAG: hypothetical protein HZB79_01910, partial [Deltaproteobacteria bacterium]|nr:hypothetical protein [Deltaproteobacteria bacterium]